MSEKGLSSLETVKHLIPGGCQVFLSGEKMNHSLVKMCRLFDKTQTQMHSRTSYTTHSLYRIYPIWCVAM